MCLWRLIESRFQKLQDHTDCSLKGLEKMIIEARLDQVNVRYPELAANMADVVSKLSGRISQCEISVSTQAPAPARAPTHASFPTVGGPTIRTPEMPGTRKQPANSPTVGGPTIRMPEMPSARQ